MFTVLNTKKYASQTGIPEDDIHERIKNLEKRLQELSFQKPPVTETEVVETKPVVEEHVTETPIENANNSKMVAVVDTNNYNINNLPPYVNYNPASNKPNVAAKPIFYSTAGTNYSWRFFVTPPSQFWEFKQQPMSVNPGVNPPVANTCNYATFPTGGGSSATSGYKVLAFNNVPRPCKVKKLHIFAQLKPHNPIDPVTDPYPDPAVSFYGAVGTFYIKVRRADPLLEQSVVQPTTNMNFTFPDDLLAYWTCVNDLDAQCSDIKNQQDTYSDDKNGISIYGRYNKHWFFDYPEGIEMDENDILLFSWDYGSVDHNITIADLRISAQYSYESLPYQDFSYLIGVGHSGSPP